MPSSQPIRRPFHPILVQGSKSPGPYLGEDNESSHGKSRQTENFPYRIELWDERKHALEQVLSLSTSAPLAYAAFYAAIKEYPTRYVILLHDQIVLSTWNGPSADLK